MMRMVPRLVIAGGLLVSLSGCLALKAQVPIAVPLKVPDPPSHVVMPPADPIVEEVPPPAAPSPTTTQPAGPKPVPPPATRPPVGTTPPPVTPPPPEPAPVLQPTANTTDLQKRIQTQMESAKRDLGKVDPHLLLPEAKAQYDWAASLYKQAEDALNAKNYNYADFLSDKAMRVASALAKGRLISPTSA